MEEREKEEWEGGRKENKGEEELKGSEERDSIMK